MSYVADSDNAVEEVVDGAAMSYCYRFGTIAFQRMEITSKARPDSEELFTGPCWTPESMACPPVAPP